jgi:hypothetical protein
VLLQPILEELQKLDGQGGLSSFEIGLKPQHLPGQGVVFGLVRCQMRVAVQPHQALLMGKMGRGIPDQVIESLGESALAMSLYQGSVQLMRDAEEAAMLSIDAADLHPERLAPLKHNQIIGRRIAKL